MGALAAALLWAALAAAAAEPPAAHELRESLWCEPAAPALALALTFDGDALFAYDFPSGRWHPRLPPPPPSPSWPSAREGPRALLRDTHLCQRLRRALTALAQGVLPEAKGTPTVQVLATRPLRSGAANRLVCVARGLFPAAARLAWQRGDAVVTRGVTAARYTPTGDGTFALFSYLAVTPRRGDVYACSVTRGEENVTTVAYWVAQDAVPDATLLPALCGTAAALGVLLGLLGAVLLLAARRRDAAHDSSPALNMVPGSGFDPDAGFDPGSGFRSGPGPDPSPDSPSWFHSRSGSQP
ncbi:class II histocompatibility antigen, M alpha chain [Eudromia elegans]